MGNFSSSFVLHLSSFIVVLTGLGLADLFYWMSLITLARGGFGKVISFGIGANVFIIWFVGSMADFTHLNHPFKMPLAAAGGTALLFILIPFILPRLVPSPDRSPKHLSEKQQFSSSPAPGSLSDPPSFNNSTEREPVFALSREPSLPEQDRRRKQVILSPEPKDVFCSFSWRATKTGKLQPR